MKEEAIVTCGVIIIIAAIVAAAFGVGWYRAGVQQEVYKRQGVEMSQWEVFLGARPVERYIKE